MGENELGRVGDPEIQGVQTPTTEQLVDEAARIGQIARVIESKASVSMFTDEEARRKSANTLTMVAGGAAGIDSVMALMSQLRNDPDIVTQFLFLVGLINMIVLALNLAIEHFERMTPVAIELDALKRLERNSGQNALLPDLNRKVAELILRLKNDT